MCIKVLFLALCTIFVCSKCDISVQVYKGLHDRGNTNISSISELSKTYAGRKDIDSIEIRKQNVPILPSEVLKGIDIEEFVVTYSHLRDVTPGVLDGCFLDHFYLSFNEIKTLRKGILNGKGLKRVSFEGNLITHIEDGALEGLSVDALILSSNHLQKLTPKMFTESNISTLILTSNQISEIGEGTFQKVMNLVYLNLNDNKLESTGDYFRNLPILRTLSLERNHIKALALQSFAGSESIFRIYLQENKITEIPRGVFNNLPLSELQLFNNSIQNVEDGAFSNMTRLATLNLSNNKLGNLTSFSLGGLNTIVELVNLQSNRIADIEGTLDGKDIYHLDLSNNSLKIIKKGMFKNSKIGTLSLKNNGISEIEVGAFEDIKGFLQLDLADNKLTEIKNGTISISLEYVNLKNNPLNYDLLKLDKDTITEEFDYDDD